MFLCIGSIVWRIALNDSESSLTSSSSAARWAGVKLSRYFALAINSPINYSYFCKGILCKVYCNAIFYWSGICAVNSFSLFCSLLKWFNYARFTFFSAFLSNFSFFSALRLPISSFTFGATSYILACAYLNSGSFSPRSSFSSILARSLIALVKKSSSLVSPINASDWPSSPLA